MKRRWILFYDGACPLCFRSKSWLFNAINKNIKLTAVDLNSDIAKQKGYSLKSVVLEADGHIFKSYHAWIKLLSETKYKHFSSPFYRPLIIIIYYIVSKNRKIISKFL